MYPAGEPGKSGGYEESNLYSPELAIGGAFRYRMATDTTFADYDLDSRRGLAIWNRVVEDYSKRSMTKEQDKLIAISGLAKDIQPNVHRTQGDGDSRYLAGLWERFLLEQLLWRVDSLPSNISVPVRQKLTAHQAGHGVRCLSLS